MLLKKPTNLQRVCERILNVFSFHFHNSQRSQWPTPDSSGKKSETAATSFIFCSDSSRNKVAGVLWEIGGRAHGWVACVHVIGTELAETLHTSFKDKWTSSCADTAWAHLISSSGECQSTVPGQIRCAGMRKCVICVRIGYVVVSGRGVACAGCITGWCTMYFLP